MTGKSKTIALLGTAAVLGFVMLRPKKASAATAETVVDSEEEDETAGDLFAGGDQDFDETSPGQPTAEAEDGDEVDVDIDLGDAELDQDDLDAAQDAAQDAADKVEAETRKAKEAADRIAREAAEAARRAAEGDRAAAEAAARRAAEEAARVAEEAANRAAREAAEAARRAAEESKRQKANQPITLDDIETRSPGQPTPRFDQVEEEVEEEVDESEADTPIDPMVLQMLTVMLADESTKNWKKSYPQLQAWQASKGMKPDGKFGPGSALALAEETGLLPIIRFWPRGASSRQSEQKAVDAWREKVAVIAADAEEPRRSQLFAAMAREQGQGFGRGQEVISPTIEV